MSLWSILYWYNVSDQVSFDILVQFHNGRLHLPSQQLENNIQCELWTIGESEKDREIKLLIVATAFRLQHPRQCKHAPRPKCAIRDKPTITSSESNATKQCFGLDPRDWSLALSVNFVTKSKIM